MKDFEIGLVLINEGKYSEFFEEFEPEDVVILSELFPENENIALIKSFNFHRIKDYVPSTKRKISGTEYKTGDCISYIMIEYKNPLDTIDNVDVEIISIHQDDISYIMENYRLLSDIRSGLLKFRLISSD
jgi:hypothetical protein